jgi:hypothetical protein
MLRGLAGLVAAAMLTGWAREAAPSDAFEPLTPAETRAVTTSTHRHVRAVDQRIGVAIAEGLSRSGTFARLVLALDESDVIVYVETARRMPSSLSGRMLLAGSGDGYRYLRIQVSAEPRANELIALLGHELRHALEVATAHTVQDDSTLLALYKTIGLSGGLHRYDTIAAQQAGRQVRAELVG